MTREKFDSLINDPYVAKIYDYGFAYLNLESKDLVIQFGFSHRGFEPNCTPPKKRIDLLFIPHIDFEKSIPLIPLLSSRLILVNAELFDYSHSYSLTYNPELNSIRVEIDEPFFEERWITDKEKEGIIYKLP
jgi:hypothetical protein